MVLRGVVCYIALQQNSVCPLSTFQVQELVTKQTPILDTMTI